MKAIEILATIFTIIGFFFISQSWLGIGFSLSFISNLLWIAWAYDSKAYGIITVNACLLLSSINGIINVFIK